MKEVAPEIYGFTGTQNGMIRVQYDSFFNVYKAISPQEFHHGDCIGADHEAHIVSRFHGCWIVIHPPNTLLKRAFCTGDVYRRPKPHLERNHDIVADVEFMVATPKEFDEVRRSGTWATIRYTRQNDKEIFIIYPDGSIIYEVTLCAVCALPLRYCVCDDIILRIDQNTGESISCLQGSIFKPGVRESRKVKVSEIELITK